MTNSEVEATLEEEDALDVEVGLLSPRLDPKATPPPPLMEAGFFLDALADRGRGIRVLAPDLEADLLTELGREFRGAESGARLSALIRNGFLDASLPMERRDAIIKRPRTWKIGIYSSLSALFARNKFKICLNGSEK